MKTCVVVLCVFCALLVDQAHALIPPHHSQGAKVGRYLKEGAFIGGLQGRDLSLLKINLIPAQNHPAERLEIVLGEANGQKLSGPMGYYHVAVEKNPPRIVVDLAQVQRTGVDQKVLQNYLSKSKFISSADFTMDPEDLSTNLTFHLRHPVSAEAFQRVNRLEGGVLVIDLKGSEGAQ